MADDKEKNPVSVFDRLLGTLIARSVHSAVFTITEDAEQANEVAAAIAGLPAAELARAGQVLGGYLQVKALEKAVQDQKDAQQKAYGLFSPGNGLKH